MLVLRVSQNIESDTVRNYSIYCNTVLEAESEEEYRQMLIERALSYEFAENCDVVRVDEFFAIKHHRGLAAVELPCTREEFDAMTDDEKELLVTPFIWGSSFIAEAGQEFVSFEASESELIWTLLPLHVFDVEETQTQVAPSAEFLNMFE